MDKLKLPKGKEIEKAANKYVKNELSIHTDLMYQRDWYIADFTAGANWILKKIKKDNG